MLTLRDLYHSIPLAEGNPTHFVPTLSDHWLQGYPYFCTLVPQASTFKSLTTGCYKHADTSRHITFNSARRADSNVTLPDSGGHPRAEVSPFSFLRTSIAMSTLRHLYHAIPLAERNPTHSVPTLSDRWSKCYPCLRTLVLQASTFTLLATECYRHADTSRPIPFDSPQRVDSNETLPDPGRHLPAEVYPFLSQLISIALRTLGNLYHSIPLT